MASKFYFDGNIYTTPAVVAAVDDSEMVPTSTQSGQTLVIVGQCEGGEPNVALEFSSPTAAKKTLVDGNLLKAVKKAFSPSADTTAPNKVLAVRVGQATQATLSLKDASSAAVIDLTSVQYGLTANKTRVKVEAGSTSGIRFSMDLDGVSYSRDNISRTAFTVQYAGTQVTATMSITDTTVTLNAPTGTVVKTIDLTTYKTIQQLVDCINTVTGFTATVGTGAADTAALNGLDAVTAQDVRTSLYSATANLQAVIDWINGLGDPLVTAARTADGGAAPAALAWTYLAGATEPALLLADWANALEALQGVDYNFLAVLSPDAAVHAAVSTHMSYMASIQKPGRAFVGPTSGTTKAQVMALTPSLNDQRVAMCWPGFYDYDDSGNLTLYPPYIMAAIVAAMHAGSAPGTPATNKLVTVNSLETNVLVPGDTDDLIDAGVLTVGKVKKGIVVIRGVSTWLSDDKYDKVEVSCGAAVDYVVRTVIDALEPTKGVKNGPRSLGRALVLTETALKGLAKAEPVGPEVIVGNDASPAYKNITASVSGDATLVSFQCSPVIPNNFVGVAIKAVPYSGTASAS